MNRQHLQTRQQAAMEEAMAVVHSHLLSLPWQRRRLPPPTTCLSDSNRQSNLCFKRAVLPKTARFAFNSIEKLTLRFWGALG